MASQVEIANRALTKVGEARIIALTDNVEAARVVSSAWAPCRDAELRTRNWNFSILRDSLPALADAPAWGYSYAYQLPADCLRVIQVGRYFPGASLTDYRTSSESEFQIENQKILTDLGAPLEIRYVSQVEDVTLWDSAFREVFACRLAIEICERLSQSEGKRQFLWKEYDQAVRLATRADAIENPPELLADDSWILSRI